MTQAINSIAISIPAYNEEHTIENVVMESISILKTLTADYEIVVIDDGSSDNTGMLLDKLSKSVDRVRIYHHSKNMGIGQALKDVFLLPSKEWVFFIPGDGQVPAKEIYKLVSFADRFDYIIGRRINRHDPVIRRINAWIYNLVISVLALHRINDIDSVVFFKRHILDGIKLKANSAFIHAEILLNILKKGVRHIEVDIEDVPRKGGTATGAKLNVIFKAGMDIVRYLFRK